MKIIGIIIAILGVVYSCSSFSYQETFTTSQNEANQTCIEDCCGTLPSRLPMSYRYYQKTGRFIGGSGSYFINTTGYSGQNKGYMNPDQQCNTDGPLPAAKYRLAYCKNNMHITTIKPCSFYLAPQEDTKMCGRGDFFIHGCACCTEGDSTVPPTNGCSAGCVIINHENRRKLRIGDTLIVYQYETNSIQIQQ